MNIGDKPPQLQFETTAGLKQFDDYHGHWLVLYFYPKDATPGCTTESCDFRDLDKEFSLYNATVLGVSCDSLTSHEKFKTKHELTFELVSDPEQILCKAFDVIQMKSMYGKEYLGIERSTFLIDPHGIVQQVWRKVRVKGHVEDVLDELKGQQ